MMLEMREMQGYDAFGSLLPGRNYSSSNYRFGFQGQEKVDEVHGSSGTHNTALFWEYDTRTARRWNLDPKPNTLISQYAAFALNPIFYRDVLGDTITINLFDSNDGPEFHAVANNAVRNQVNDGVFLVFAHGASAGVQYTDAQCNTQLAVSASEFNAVVSARSPEYGQALKDGTQIVLRLNSCTVVRNQTDLKDNPIPNIAEKISSSLPDGSTVIAPDGYCMYGTKGGKPAIVGVSEKIDGWDPSGKSGYETLVNGQTKSQKPMSWNKGTGSNPQKPKENIKAKDGVEK